MDRLLKKKTYFALLYVFTALLIEIITFCVMGLGVFPSFWGIDLAFILGLAIIIFVIPSPVASIVVNGVLLGVQVIVAFINEALYRMSGMVFIPRYGGGRGLFARLRQLVAGGGARRSAGRRNNVHGISQ